MWGIWSAITIWDTIQAQFVPVQDVPTIWEIVIRYSPNWPLWLWGLIGLGILVAAVLEGSYRIHKKLASELNGKVQGKPVLELATNPEVVVGHMADSKSGTPICELFAASIMIRNKPATSTSESDAKDVYSMITYYDSDGKEELIDNIFGNWNEKGYHSFPKQMLQQPQASDSREITLKSTGLPCQLILAIKHKEDDNCYAFGVDSLRYTWLKNPRYELKGRKFQISIRLVGKDVSKTFKFQLSNRGKGGGMEIGVF